MEQYKYPGFDKLPDDSPAKYSLPLCDLLQSFLGEDDFAYIAAAFVPLELTELILHYFHYSAGVEQSKIDRFAEKYFTEDSLYPIDKLIAKWGIEKFNQMITELQDLAAN